MRKLFILKGKSVSQPTFVEYVKTKYFSILIFKEIDLYSKIKTEKFEKNIIFLFNTKTVKSTSTEWENRI